jgi:hypothetical protein
VINLQMLVERSATITDTNPIGNESRTAKPMLPSVLRVGARMAHTRTRPAQLRTIPNVDPDQGKSAETKNEASEFSWRRSFTKVRTSPKFRGSASTRTA